MAVLQAENIDQGARGYLRAYAFRQLGASIGVIVLALVTAYFVFTMSTDAALLREDPGLIACVVPSVLALTSGVVAVLILLLGGLFDLLPRRLLGLLLMLGVWSVSLLTLFVAFAMFVAAIGLVDSDSPLPSGWLGEIALTVWAVFVLFFELSLVRFAWWLLAVPRDQYLAARGFRPRWAPFATVWRYLGLPPYLRWVRRGWLRLLLLHGLIAVVNSALVAWIVLPFTWSVDPTFEWWNLALLGLLVVQVLGLGRWLAGRAEALATTKYQDVQQWDGRPPVLFLRRFDNDSRVLSSEISLDPVIHWAGADRVQSFDELLLEHATPYGPLVAIGDPRDPVPPLGAARIFVEGAGEEWKDVVRALAQAANVIVMCVDDSEGVRWELALIGLAEVRHKVILLANPLLDPVQNFELFAAVAPELRELDLQLEDELVAAFRDPQRGWRVLVATEAGLPAFAVSFNVALQAMRGHQGVPVRRPRR